MNSFIELKNVIFKYNKKSEKEILSNISFSVNKGEFIALMGANGCGKSTLLKHLNALIIPDSGEVLIDNMNTKDETFIAKIRSLVGMIFQNPDNQIINSIVEDDVAFGPENLGIASEIIRDKVDKTLKMIGLYEKRESQTNTLSGGQKQKLAIAGVLVMNPSCILLDEPTSMLDPVSKFDLINFIKKLNKELKITIIMITHDIDEAILSNRIIVMDDGKIVIDDKPLEVLKKYEILNEIGVEMPETLELMLRLKEKGFGSGKPIIDTKQCANEIDKLLKGKM